MLLKERTPGCYRVSLRSRDKVDVSQVAGTFGGGGHARAAGLELTGVSQDIVEDILTEISRYLNMVIIILDYKFLFITLFHFATQKG